MSQHMLTCKLEFSPFTENSFCFGRLNALFCLIIESWFLQIGSTQENFEDGVVKREDLWITSKLRFYCLLTLLKIVMFLNVGNICLHLVSEQRFSASLQYIGAQIMIQKMYQKCQKELYKNCNLSMLEYKCEVKSHIEQK